MIRVYHFVPWGTDHHFEGGEEGFRGWPISKKEAIKAQQKTAEKKIVQGEGEPGGKNSSKCLRLHNFGF